MESKKFISGRICNESWLSCLLNKRSRVSILFIFVLLTLNQRQSIIERTSWTIRLAVVVPQWSQADCLEQGFRSPRLQARRPRTNASETAKQSSHRASLSLDNHQVSQWEGWPNSGAISYRAGGEPAGPNQPAAVARETSH